MSIVPPTWPAARPLAIAVAVMLEGWTEPDAPGIGPMGNPLKPGAIDLQARSWAEYGAKVGAWRLLDLLDREAVRAVFYTSGVVADRYPELVATIALRGHAVAAHGWSQGTLPPYLTEHAEAADIARCVDVLTRTAGAHPAGWLSPRCTPSAHTARLLAHAGFRWHADTFDSDLPYPIATEAGSLLAMPFTMEYRPALGFPPFISRDVINAASGRCDKRAGWMSCNLTFTPTCGQYNSRGGILSQ